MTTKTPTLGPCHCKPGQQRDNCPACEGTGQQIDFRTLRRRNRVKRIESELRGIKWAMVQGEPISEAKRAHMEELETELVELEALE